MPNAKNIPKSKVTDQGYLVSKHMPTTEKTQ